MADRPAKEAAMEDKEEIVYEKIPKTDHNYRRDAERNSKIAGAVDKFYKRSSKQIIFPTLKREVKYYVTYISRI
jgi:hypothetical protein